MVKEYQYHKKVIGWNPVTKKHSITLNQTSNSKRLMEIKISVEMFIKMEIKIII